MSADVQEPEAESGVLKAAAEFYSEDEVEPVQDDVQDEEVQDEDSVDDSADESTEDVSDDEDSTDDDQEETAEESGPQFSQEVLFEAAKAGLSFDDVKRLGNDDAVLAHLSLASKGEEAEEGEAEAQEPEWFELALGEDIDDDIAAGMKGMNEHAKKVFTEQQQRLEVMEQFIMQMDQERFDQSVESGFSAMSDFEEEFGKGVLEEVSETAKANRHKVVGTAVKMRDMDAEKGKTLPFHAYMKKAAEIEFSDKLKERAKKEIVKKTKSRKKIGKPNAKPADTGEDDAEAGALKLLREGLKEMRGE